jgi:hypothetical protein
LGRKYDWIEPSLVQPNQQKPLEHVRRLEKLAADGIKQDISMPPIKLTPSQLNFTNGLELKARMPFGMELE